MAQAQKELHLRMFIRKKKNRSGTTSIVVVEKRKGIYREIITIGISNDTSEIESLYLQGKKWISGYLGEQDIFEVHDKAIEERQQQSNILNHILMKIHSCTESIAILTNCTIRNKKRYRRLVLSIPDEF